MPPAPKWLPCDSTFRLAVFYAFVSCVKTVQLCPGEGISESGVCLERQWNKDGCKLSHLRHYCEIALKEAATRAGPGHGTITQ